MNNSEPSAESAGATPHFPGDFQPAVHGHEPGQTDLGPHPGDDFIGYYNDCENPEKFTINARDATAEDLCYKYVTADAETVEQLGEWL